MQLLTFLCPVLYALFLWWFTTGLIIVVYGRSLRLVRLWFLGATLTSGIALWGLVATRHQTQPRDVYLAFTCGLVIWGWQTASYYLGYITGLRHPEPEHLHAGVPSKQPRRLTSRFWQAVGASLYHELFVIGIALLLIILTWSQANRWGLWIYLAMWVMHLSAKINVFLGVRNFRIEFLPAHLHHLDGLLNKQTSNVFLPVSVVMASSIALAMFYRGIAPGASPSQTTGYLLLGTMIGLGILEHILLILPISATIWGWGVRLLPKVGGKESVPRRHAGPSMRALPKQNEQMIEG